MSGEPKTIEVLGARYVVRRVQRDLYEVIGQEGRGGYFKAASERDAAEQMWRRDWVEQYGGRRAL